MLYSLDIAEPHIMGRLLKGGSTLPKRIFEGTYTIVKREVRIKVKVYNELGTVVLELFHRRCAQCLDTIHVHTMPKYCELTVKSSTVQKFDRTHLNLLLPPGSSTL